MYFCNNNSKEKIVHLSSCYHIVDSKSKNYSCFDNLRKALDNGCRPCRHCFSLRQRYLSEKDNIQNYCMKYNYILAFNADSIEITTSKGQWKIIQAKYNKKLELYHKNTEERFSDKFSRISGYHNQRFLGYEMTDYVEYIFNHDGRCKAPPLKGTKRYRSQQKRLAKLERRNSINNVIRLIDGLHVQVSG